MLVQAGRSVDRLNMDSGVAGDITRPCNGRVFLDSINTNLCMFLEGGMKGFLENNSWLFGTTLLLVGP